MTDTHITSYADAVLAAAKAENAVPVVEEEMFRFARALEGSDELRSTLSDPHLPAINRVQIVEDLLGGKASPTTVGAISMLVLANRTHDLGAVADEFVQRAAAERGQAVAEVRSAVPLSDEQQTRLAAALTTSLGRQVTVRNVVDPTVVGGVVAQVGDTLFDGSVRTRLTQLREAF